MVKFYNWVGLSLLLILSCGNPINITGPKYSDVIVTKMTFYDQLIIKGSRFKDITAVALRDPKTGQIIKRFKVSRYDDHEILGEQLDYNKIPIPNLLDLLIDTAQGQSVIPVQFSINENSVYTAAIQNGAITPTKFKGVSQPPPGPDIVALNYDPVTENFFFAIPSSGGGGGGGGGITQIAFGEGIVGEGGVSSGTSVGVSVNVGETGSSTVTYIPYFSVLNELTIDSTTNSNTRLLFLDNNKKVSLNFDNNLFKIHDDSITLPSSIGDLLTVDLTGKVTAATSLFVGTQRVCLANGTGCPTGIQPITGVPPIIVNGPQVSADTGTAPGQLVILDDGSSTPTGPGFLPGVDGSHLRNIVTKINALDGITVTNGGIGIVDIGLAPAGSTGSAQPWDPALEDISDIPYPPVNGEMIIGASGTYVGQSGATLRKSIGLEIGVDVQPFNPNLDQISNATPTAAGQFLLSSNPGQWAIANNPDCGTSGHLMAGDGTSFNCSGNNFTFKLKEIQFFETVAAGGSYVGFAAPVNVLTTTIWALPAQDGLNGQVLTTDGLKNLYWGTGNGDVRGPNSATDNALARFDTNTGKLIQNSTVILDDVGNLTGVGNINGTPSGNFVTGPVNSVNGNLASFDLATGKVIKDSLIPSADVVTMAAPGTGIYVLESAIGFKTAKESNILIANVPTMAANATGTYQPILSFAPGKALISAGYSIPLGICPNGEILKSNGTNFICGADSDTAPPVTSVFTRTGDITAQFGDYTANLIESVPTGFVSAGNVQGAITELDDEKLALIGGNMTGPINSVAQNALQVGPYGVAPGNTGEIHYLELAAQGAQFVGFKAPDSIGSNVIWTLPAAAGASGTVLTNTTGNILNWSSPSAIGIGDVVGPASSTDNAIARFNSTTGKIIKNSTVSLDDTGNLSGVASINGAASSNFVTMATTPAAANYVYLSNGNDKTAKTTTYTFPPGPCGANEILKTDGTFNFKCVLDTSGVISFNGRSGLVVSQTGDYTGSQVLNTGAGSIAATNTQGAINELDLEKIAAAGGTMTGPLVFGNSGGLTGEIRYMELSGNGGQYVGFKAPDSINTSLIWTLPGADGTTGQLLSTNGLGVLNWISAGGASGVGDVVGPVSSTSTNLASFNGPTGKLIQDSGISSTNVVTMGAGAIIGNVLMSGGGKSAQDSFVVANNIVTNPFPFSVANRIVLSAGSTKVVTETGYTIPPVIGTATYILKSDGTNATWQPDLDTVYSVFGRNGAVVAVAGDYDAIQVDNTPAGNISALNVQAAINELDSEKLALAGGTMTGTLITTNQTAIQIGPSLASSTGELRFFEAGGGPNYAGLKSPAVLNANYILTLPPDIGSPTQILSTTGGGVLSWTTPGGGGAGGVGDVVGPASSSPTNLASFSNATGKLIQDSGISSTNVMTMTLPAASGGKILTSQGANKIAIDTGINVSIGNDLTGLGTLNTRTIANWVDGPASATSTNLASFNGTRAIQDSGLSTANIPTMVLDATAPNQMILSGGISKQLVATPYTVPNTNGLNGQVLTVTGANTTAWLAPAGTGNVFGPGSATSDALVRFDSTTGKLIKNSVAILDDAGNLSGITSINTKTAADLVTMPTSATTNGQVMLSTAAGKALTPSPYTFQATAGGPGQVLKLDPSGLIATWQTIGGGDVTGPATSGSDTLAVFADTTGKLIKSVTLTYLNIVTSPANFTAANRIALTGGNNKTLIETPYTFPTTNGSANQVPKTDGLGSVTWQADSTLGPNDVQNVGGSTDNAIARFNGTGGKDIQNSVVTISDTGDLLGVTTINGNPAANLVTLVATPTTDDRIFLSNAGSKTAKTSPFTIPPIVCPSGQVLKSDGTNYACSNVGSGDVIGPATSVAGRPATYLDATGKTLANTVPYTIPIIPGIPGQVLTTDGVNSTSWTTITPGTGDVVGPASSVIDQVALFSGASGKTIKASPYTLPTVNGTAGQALTTNGAGVASWSNVGNVAGAASSIAGNIPSFSDASGKALQDSNIPSANIVQMPNAATFVGQLLMSNGPGKQAQPSPYKFPTDTLGSAGKVLTSNGLDVIWANAAGDVVGQGTSAVNEVAVYADTTGKLIKSVSISALNIVQNTATPTVPNHVAVFDSATGKSIADSGKLIGDLVTGPVGALVGNLASYSVANGKTIQDSGISTTNVVQNLGGSTDNAIARFDLTSGKIIQNSTVILGNGGDLSGVTSINGKSSGDFVTLVATPTAGNYVYLSNGADKTAKTTTYTFPPGPCAANQILKTDGSFNFQCVNDTSGVASFNGRIGAVMPGSSDYTASMVGIAAIGAITSTSTQGAINELELEKLALTGGIMTGDLTTTSLITNTQNGVQVGPSGANTGEVRFLEQVAGGDYVGFKAPNSLAGNVIWTLPAAAGASGTVLTTNNSNVLTWSSPSAIGVGDVTGPASSSDNAIARFDQTTGKLIQNSVITISDGGDLSGVASFTSTGNFSVSGTGSFTGGLSAQSYTNTSDKSLKKEIKPFTGASSIVDKLMPVTFRWKNGDEKQVIGLIAQDMEKVIPEVISQSNQKGNTIKSYDLGQVLILTLEALKETREELKETRNELKVLRDKVKDLEKSKL